MSLRAKGQTMRTVLATAQHATRLGLCVVPPREDGTKAPDAPSWKTFQTRLPTSNELNDWYAHRERHGVGLVCGKISGGLELFEFEAAAVEQGLHTQWAEIMRNIGEHELANRLLDGYSERSASGGLHFLYRCEYTRTEKLASTIDHKTLIETKGEGGYVIIAPSHGPVSPNDGQWELLTGSLDTIPTITIEERNTIHRVARSLDPSARETTTSTTATNTLQWKVVSNTSNTHYLDSPLDLFRADPQINEQIARTFERHGWTRCGQTGDTIYIRRPGKTHGISATIGHVAPGVTTIFTTSTALDARTYSPADIYAHLEHDGNMSAATRALRDAGYRNTTTQAAPITADTPTIVDTTTKTDDDDDSTSWEPVDLDAIWRGETIDTPPSILARIDGINLVYPGKVNTFQGESESMKTWCALCAVAEQLARGNTCVYIDFEDSPTSVIERLRALGVSPKAPFIYIRPDQPFSYKARDQIDAALTQLAPVALVVLDGVTEAMTLQALDLMSNKDIATWMKMLPRWIARHHTQPAVITIDHVPKNPDGRGKGAIGGQHKRAGIDGIGLTFTVGAEPLARGRDGRARITVDKDRPGHVRAHTDAKGRVGDLVIRHYGDQLRWSIEPVEEQQTERENLADTILAILRDTPEETWSRRALSTELRARNHAHANEAIQNVLELLAADGQIEQKKGRTGYPEWHLTPVDNLLCDD